MFDRTKRNELFLRASTNFFGENRYYEDSEVADHEVINLARQAAVYDWDWFSKMLIWLRSEGQIRTASIALALEGVHERLGASLHGYAGGEVSIPPLPDPMSNRQLIAGVLQRPDEPAEAASYWIGHWGRSIPKPVKRGIADSVTRMYSQKQALRWDKPADPVRMGDVIELVHPRPRKIPAAPDGALVTDEVQGKLYSHLITSRHDRDGYVPDSALGAIVKREELNKLTPSQRHEYAFKALDGKPELTGFQDAMANSWEWAKSWLGEQ